jgi:hypothetical protein
VLSKQVRKLLGKQSKQEIFEDKANELNNLVKHCKEKGWLTRKDWKVNNVEMDKAIQDFFNATVAYSNYMYDQNTALPLDRG